VLIFFIAGLLFMCFKNVEHWERIASRGDRPSPSKTIDEKRLVKLL